jgi:hypothetical protein
MNYCWSILIIIVVISALYAMGPLNPATWTRATATGFGEIGVPEAGAWRLKATGTDNFIVNLKNNVGSRINITDVTVKFDNTECTSPKVNNVVNANPPVTLSIRDPFNITATCTGVGSAGSRYTVTVEITYDNLQTGLTGFKDSGTLTGKIAAG